MKRWTAICATKPAWAVKVKHKKVCLYLHKLCPERKILQDMTADSVHSSTGRKGPDSCHSDLVCQSMSNSPCDIALLQTHTKNTVKVLRRQIKLRFTNTHLNYDHSQTSIIIITSALIRKSQWPAAVTVHLHFPKALHKPKCHHKWLNLPIIEQPVKYHLLWML